MLTLFKEQTSLKNSSIPNNREMLTHEAITLKFWVQEPIAFGEPLVGIVGVSNNWNTDKHFLKVKWDKPQAQD